MKQKLIKAETELRSAFVMARANRMEIRLANQLRDTILALEQCRFILYQLEGDNHYAN
jgi:hypothetical protein